MFASGSISLYGHATVCISTHELWTFVLFLVWPSTIEAANNIHPQIFAWTYNFISFSKYLGREWLDQMASLCLTFEKTDKLNQNCIISFSSKQ
jgi:hypothetical protein